MLPWAHEPVVIVQKEHKGQPEEQRGAGWQRKMALTLRFGGSAEIAVVSATLEGGRRPTGKQFIDMIRCTLPALRRH